MIFKGHLDSVRVQKYPQKKSYFLLKKNYVSFRKTIFTGNKRQDEMSLNRCEELGPGFYPNDWTHTGEKPNRQGKLFSTIIILERNHIVESKNWDSF